MSADAYSSTLDQLEIVDLERRLVGVCHRLIGVCDRQTGDEPELRTKFRPAIAEIQKVVIGPLDPKWGSFKQDGEVLFLNEEPVINLLAVVLDDIRTRMNGGHALAASEIPDFLERALSAYMFHELRHKTQGIGLYSEFSVARNIAGLSFMNDMDLYADRDAAMAYAYVYSASDTRSEYLRLFQEALLLSSAYYFKAFGFGCRPDKIDRAASILMMAARLSRVSDFGNVKETIGFPLDAPLVVKTNRTSLAIFQGAPNLRYLGAANDEKFGLLISSIESGNFDTALEASVSIANDLRLVS